MSDLCMYEFGDIVWDEFCQSEDHTVPHPISEEAIEHSFLGDSRKRTRHELIGVSGNAREQSANKNIFQEKDQENISVLDSRRKIMLEKNSWSHTPNGVFPSSCDSNSAKEVSSLASDGTRTSSHCLKSNNTDLVGDEFCVTDSILIDKSAAVDSNSYDYPLDPMPQTDNDLSFFGDDHNDKDSSDFLYYAWPDIGNFEDVDRMFRSCDSTFGLGASSEDELGWFSSSDAMEGSGDVLKSEISCPSAPAAVEKNSENDELIRANGTCSSINDSSLKSASASCKITSWLSDKVEPDTSGHLSLVNATCSSNSKADFRHRKQGVELNGKVQQKISVINHLTTGNSGTLNMHKKQQRHHNQSEAKRKDPYGGSFYCNGTIATEEKKLPSETTSQQAHSSVGIQLQKQALRPESFGYLQNNIPSMQSDYGHPSDHTSVFPTLSAGKSDSSGFTNISPRESSYSSNQVLSAESSHGTPFQVTSNVPSEKKEKLHHQQAFQSSFNNKAKNVEMRVQVPLCDSVSLERKAQHSARKLKNHADHEGVPGEFGSSTVQESSSVSSGLDENSLEAASFRQLQLVMEQLDPRTKLRIRDSLYRLARSAEQRHNRASLKDSYCGDDRDASGVLVAEGTNKCTGFMDIETDTNPIDRSVAHLLFHRPSDSSVIPAQDALSFKSPAPIHGSVSSPPLMPERSVTDEAMATEMEGNVECG
ncbi:hypothetical protein ACH5RR_001995 [Cinchona calisaya]|uniref:Protein LNK1 n=1 Tax=Cinchona calisaya TaxID=153742 RepID=A0ABD3B5A9_9GENT